MPEFYVSVACPQILHLVLGGKHLVPVLIGCRRAIGAGTVSCTGIGKS